MNIIMRDDTEYGVEYVRLDAVQDYLNTTIAAERNACAQWMMARGFSTGHGDTVVDLLKELEWQVRERVAKECIRLCDQVDYVGADDCIDNIKEHFGVEE